MWNANSVTKKAGNQIDGSFSIRPPKANTTPRIMLNAPTKRVASFQEFIAICQ